MKTKKRLLTVVLTLALGLGVWTLAFTFQTADFGSGDVLSAGELNTLLNDNFQAASDAMVHNTGDTITGRTNIVGEASSTGETGDVSTLFRVANTSSDEGSAAVFQSENDSNAGAVSVKQAGSGPALTLKSNGGGPLISGAGSARVTFIVEDDGSISIGDMGTDGSGEPVLSLDAVEGTVTNDVGSGLPLAFGYVNASGDRVSGTTNFDATLSGGEYRITIDGESYDRTGYATIIQGVSPLRYDARADADGGDLTVTIHSADGTENTGAFHFVTYKDGH